MDWSVVSEAFEFSTEVEFLLTILDSLMYTTDVTYSVHGTVGSPDRRSDSVRCGALPIADSTILFDIPITGLIVSTKGGSSSDLVRKEGTDKIGIGLGSIATTDELPFARTEERIVPIEL